MIFHCLGKLFADESKEKLSPALCLMSREWRYKFSDDKLLQPNIKADALCVV